MGRPPLRGAKWRRGRARTGWLFCRPDGTWFLTYCDLPRTEVLGYYRSPLRGWRVRRVQGSFDCARRLASLVDVLRSG